MIFIKFMTNRNRELRLLVGRSKYGLSASNLAATESKTLASNVDGFMRECLEQL
jgi:hypothetical protein